MHFYHLADQTANSLVKMAAEQTEASILNQLNDFISRGLIVIEVGPTSLTTDISDDYQVRIQRTVNLRLKDKDYIEKLEKENVEMRDLISKIKSMTI